MVEYMAEIREKEKVFLLDTPISQSGLFGEAVSSVVEKFRSAKTQSAALRQFHAQEDEGPFHSSSSLSREQSLPRKEPSGRSDGLGEPVAGLSLASDHCRRVDLKRPNRPAASAPPSHSDLRVGMRRAASPPRG